MPASKTVFASTTGVPITVSDGNSIIPLWSSPIPNSRAEHIIPFDTTPRNLPDAISCPSITQPGTASADINPTRALGAPHTTWRKVPVPSSTINTCRWSLFSCGLHSTIFAAIGGIGDCKSSTSSPIRVKVSAICAADASVFKYSINQSYVHFIFSPVLEPSRF